MFEIVGAITTVETIAEGSGIRERPPTRIKSACDEGFVGSYGDVNVMRWDLGVCLGRCVIGAISRVARSTPTAA